MPSVVLPRTSRRQPLQRLSEDLTFLPGNGMVGKGMRDESPKQPCFIYVFTSVNWTQYGKPFGFWTLRFETKLYKYEYEHEYEHEHKYEHKYEHEHEHEHEYQHEHEHEYKYQSLNLFSPVF